jgi:hypothetical protein
MSTREELIARLVWNNGGMSYGVCSFAGMLISDLDRPGPGKPDLKSIVAVSSPPEKYTDEELQKLVAFSEEQTAAWDRISSCRRGANYILINKQDENSWYRKRVSWDMGLMHSPTLDEALAVFTRRECRSQAQVEHDDLDGFVGVSDGFSRMGRIDPTRRKRGFTESSG